MPFPEPQPVPERFPISERLDAERVRVGPGEAENRLKTGLLSALTKRAKKLQRLATNLDGDRAKLERMQAEARFGELLKSMLHAVPKGAHSIDAIDWSTGETIAVRLDPSLSAKANMERYFAKAKKAARGAPIVEKRLAKVQAELEQIRRERERIEGASGDALQQIASRTELGSGSIAEAREPEAKKKPIDKWSRKFVALDGSEIRVGRGASENDRLTLNGARGHDLWLHARGTAGAHVVLRVEKGSSPDREAILDAAHLAVFYSSAKNDTKVEVITTDAKNVRKTKGDPPGRVSVARGKTILIEIDPARLDRLLGKETP
jgi:predicted ribosome quality control (RQC) complex YloA/Tae2 family protein